MIYTTYIELNRQYRVANAAITYNSVVYQPLAYFTGVASVSSFTGSGNVVALTSVNSLSVGVKSYVDDLQITSISIGVKSYVEDTRISSISIGIKSQLQTSQIISSIN